MATESFRPASIGDRATWARIATDARVAAQIKKQLDRLDAIPPTMPLPTAADYLAAKRSNNRGILDDHWRKTRPNVARLTLNRLLSGIDSKDADDRLLNWLFAFTYEPTWTVSAHLPNQDLPTSGRGQLDLAGCEAAGELAEAREALLPWIETNSKTLGDSIASEIDRRVLTPFLTDTREWWAKLDAKRTDAKRINNWTGVCAGSILIAAQSLEATGFPRPEARDKALALLRVFFDVAFGEAGECEEGIGYWMYGIEYAVLGMMRLSAAQLRKEFDLDRVKVVAGYPERCHLAGRLFFAGNDSEPRMNCAPIVGSWLADVTGSSFLRWWAGYAPEGEIGAVRSVPHLLRLLQDPCDVAPTTQAAGPAHAPNRYLADQQAAIFQRPTARGLFTFTITGGTNAELHNHNDLGTFQLFVDERTIIPDLGQPRYVMDFFDDKVRYTKYMVAASSGHCCPSINGVEQRAGAEAAGKLVGWHPESGEISLDLTSAYPAEAKLKRWTRSAHVPIDDAIAIMTDEFELDGDGEVVHRIWFVDEPKVSEGGATISADGATVTFDPKPKTADVMRIKAGDERLMLRGYKAEKELYRVDQTYRVKANERLVVTTRLSIV
jgi:hypothetical protein